MNTLHFFLTAGMAQAPQRWRQAFVSGQELDWPALQVRCAEIQAGGAERAMVWIGTSDPHWAERVASLAGPKGGCQVVVLTPTMQDDEALRALELGARGYGHVYSVPQLLREIALVVSHGGLWPGPGLVDRMVAATSRLLAAGRPPEAPAPDLSMLSAREAEVARAVAAGQSNKEVAGKLGISERTVKAHLGAIFEKLGVRDRLQLVLYLSAPARPMGSQGDR